MALSINDKNIKKVTFNNTEIKQVFYNNKLVFKAVSFPEIEYRINGGNWVRSKVTHIVNSLGNPFNGQYAICLSHDSATLSLVGLENHSLTLNNGDTLEIRPVTKPFEVIGLMPYSSSWEPLPGDSGDRYTLMSNYAMSDYGFSMSPTRDFIEVYYGLGFPE